ncbi:DUF6314 family protein [Rubrivirga sp.]|uniref:DUF6314 family protein n=1 Tax=Rubrivirga sp. TaxID=1885344 RepID=UPI003B526AB7
MTAAAVLVRLAAASRAAVEVRSGADGGSGAGDVTATTDGGAVVLAEAGTWTPAGARPMRWRAVSRWRAQGAALAVEHLRQEAPARVVLDLGPDGVWAGREPHACGADLYAVGLRIVGDALEVTWTVSGPRKSARVVTRYGGPGLAP